MKTLLFKFWIDEDSTPDGEKRFITVIGKPITSDDYPNGYIWFDLNCIKLHLETCVIDLNSSSKDWNDFFSVVLDEEFLEVEMKHQSGTSILLNMPIEYDD